MKHRASDTLIEYVQIVPKSLRNSVLRGAARSFGWPNKLPGMSRACNNEAYTERFIETAMKARGVNFRRFLAQAFVIRDNINSDAPCGGWESLYGLIEGGYGQAHTDCRKVLYARRKGVKTRTDYR